MMRLGVVLLFAVTLCFSQAAEEDKSTYELPIGINCFKCPAGTMVLEDCKQSLTNSTCTPCDPHHYSNKPNGKRHCELCRQHCPRYGYEYQNCTSRTNRECICDKGYHRFPVDPYDPQFECRKHTVCADDEGYDFKGNHTRDAVCRKCVDGQEFLNRTDAEYPRCDPCTENTVCQGNYTGSTTSHTSTASTTTIAGTSESNSLSPGAVAAIVIVSVVIIAILLIGIWCYRRRRNQPSNDEAGGETTTALEPLMVSSNGGVAGGGETGASNGGGETVANPPSDSSDNRLGQEEAGVDQPQSSSSNQLGHQNEEATADVTNKYNWSYDFITKEVFYELSHSLGGNWENFIYRLPDLPAQRIQSIIDQKKEENHTVPNRIRSCLIEWSRRCPDKVTRENIAKALREISHEELLEELQRKHEQHLASSG